MYRQKQILHNVENQAILWSMKKEIGYINIEEFYGGNQEWLPTPFMRMGGCAAVTACEIMVYLASRGRRELYPYNTDKITKEDFTAFAAQVAVYLHPRLSGVDSGQTFIHDLKGYLAAKGLDLTFTQQSSDLPAEKAFSFICEHIDKGLPLAYLMLRHKDKSFGDFVWHWWVITGYETAENTRCVICASFGQRHVFDFDRLYDTGFSRRGCILTME